MGRRRGNSAFPVARIKKMMQADDDVGKIATVTPVLVAKALECMMEHVLTEAADVARVRHTKTVTPQHLHYCVANNDHFDFLRPTLAHVPPLEDKLPASEPGSARRTRAKRPRSPAAPKRKQHDDIEDVDMSVPKRTNSVPEVPLPGKRRKVKPLQTPSLSAPVLPDLPKVEPQKEEDDDENYDDDEEEEEEEKPSSTPALSAPSLPAINAIHGAGGKESDDAKPSERVSVHALLS